MVTLGNFFDLTLRKISNNKKLCSMKIKIHQKLLRFLPDWSGCFFDKIINIVVCWIFKTFWPSSSRPWRQTNLNLNSIEKVKLSFLLSLMCKFPEFNGIKFWSHSFHLQNSGILQTRMEQREDPMLMNFDNFQIQKWIPQTVRAQKVDEKNGLICLVSFFLLDL